jgi:hypothetical protein
VTAPNAPYAKERTPTDIPTSGRLKSEWRRALERVRPGSRLGAAFLAVLTIAIGLLSGEDRARHGLVHWNVRAPFEPLAVWLAVAILAVVGYTVWDQWTREQKDRAADINRVALQKHLAALQTLPERSALGAFDEAARSAYGAFNVVLQPKTERSLEQVVEAIRLVLWSVINVVKAFDDTPRPQPEYSANIMFFVPRSRIKGRALARLQPSFRFGADGVHLPNLLGVLELQCDLSVAERNGAGDSVQCDTVLQPLVLPLPNDNARINHALGLPGAPAAFCNAAMDVCHDVFAIQERCVAEQTALPDVARQIHDFFHRAEAKHIRSFASIAVMRARDPRKARAVVNINCSVPGLLKDVERQKMILPMLRTVLWPLPEMLDRLTAESKPPRPWDLQ